VYLITSDLHFTDNPKDQYRFDLFPWLKEQAARYGCSYLFILGDITDKKDKHSSKLTNKIIDCLTDLSKNLKIFILFGNHDGLDSNLPFFKFLNKIPNIKFIFDIKRCMSINEETFMFLPHTRDPQGEWKDLDFSEADYIFMHQTFTGALASTKKRLDGMHQNYLRDAKGVIISGDIHVPQQLGKVTYVGSPYNIHFGDEFEPRILMIRDGDISNLHFPCLKKHTVVISSPGELSSKSGLEPRDQVKIRLNLDSENLVEWTNYRKEVMKICDEMNLDLYGIELIEDKGETQTGIKCSVNIKNWTKLEVFDRFCEDESVDSYTVDIGREILDEVPQTQVH
jgi:DNA repair exonuclease SbcCD nuclease subunit